MLHISLQMNSYRASHFVYNKMHLEMAQTKSHFLYSLVSIYISQSVVCSHSSHMELFYLFFTKKLESKTSLLRQIKDIYRSSLA